MFELISQRYERGATIITSNLPFDEWTATFGEERLTGALLDRLLFGVRTWTLLTKVETSCDRILIAGGANVEAKWEQGPAV